MNAHNPYPSTGSTRSGVRVEDLQPVTEYGPVPVTGYGQYKQVNKGAPPEGGPRSVHPARAIGGGENREAPVSPTRPCGGGSAARLEEDGVRAAIARARPSVSSTGAKLLEAIRPGEVLWTDELYERAGIRHRDRETARKALQRLAKAGFVLWQFSDAPGTGNRKLVQLAAQA